MNTKGRVTVRGANALFLISMLLQFAVGIAATILIIIIFTAIRNSMPPNSVLTYILLVLTQIFAILLPAIVYLKYKGADLKSTLRLKPINPIHALFIIILGITGQFIAQMLNLPVMLLLDWIGEVPPSPLPTPHTFNELMVSLAIIGIAPAVCEEILVRGVILSAYEIRGTWAGILISALFFGFMHGDIKNLVGPIFFGIVFAYVVVRTGSIFAGMIAHLTNNALAVMIDYLFENYRQYVIYLDNYAYFFLVGFVSIAIFTVTMWAFNRMTRLEAKPSISTTRQHLKAAFVNIPVILTMVIFFALQVFVIIEVLNGKT